MCQVAVSTTAVHQIPWLITLICMIGPYPRLQLLVGVVGMEFVSLIFQKIAKHVLMTVNLEKRLMLLLERPPISVVVFLMNMILRRVNV